MSKNSGKVDDDPVEPEYDFSKGVRGKYSGRFADGTNLIILDPDVAKEFPDSQSVNEALRSLLKTGRRRGGEQSD